jgi:ADP-heptose:LPS heptosyltransferase
MSVSVLAGELSKRSIIDGRSKHVVISPYANERIKEWPDGHFRDLIRRIVGDRDMRVIIVGTRAQRVRANALVREFSAIQVVNTCGQLQWSEVARLIDDANCVITNNSGIGHFAAKRGRWTLCVFGACHSWLEWMPRGPRVILITRMTACSPCEIGNSLCPNELVCMGHLTADAVYIRFLEIQARAEEERSAALYTGSENAAKELASPIVATAAVS